MLASCLGQGVCPLPRTLQPARTIAAKKMAFIFTASVCDACCQLALGSRASEALTTGVTRRYRAPSFASLGEKRTKTRPRERHQVSRVLSKKTTFAKKKCGAYPFVGYCGSFLNKLALPKNSTRHPMNAKVKRRQDEWRRDVSHPDFWYGGLTGDEITPDRRRSGQDACGIRAQGPAG